MPPKKVEKKKAQKNKRKSRTEVESSPSPSPSTKSSDSDSVAPSPRSDTQETLPARQQQPSSSPEPTTTPPIQKLPPKLDTDAAFQTFYLQQATQEFANDLDKLRSAGDFHGERSVGMLVRALREGTRCFSREERGRVVGAGEGR